MKVKLTGYFINPSPEWFCYETEETRVFGINGITLRIYYTREDTTPMAYTITLKNFMKSVANIDDKGNFEFESSAFNIKCVQDMIRAVNEEDKHTYQHKDNVCPKDVVDKANEVLPNKMAYAISASGFIDPLEVHQQLSLKRSGIIEVKYSDLVFDFGEWGSIAIKNEHPKSTFQLTSEKCLSGENAKVYEKRMVARRQCMLEALKLHFPVR